MARPVPKLVIWMTADHMRYDCIGAHGNAAMHTPNLDRLANEGISFDQCYVQSPLCMPSRCSFMTGLYPQQTGVTQNGCALRPDFEPTVATAFNAGGFQTAQIGKLHFQPHEEYDLEPRPRHTYGFDTFLLSEEPGCYEDAYLKWLRNERPDFVETFRVARPVSPERRHEVEGKVLDAPWEYSHSGWVAEAASRFIEKQCLDMSRQSRQFMHLGFYAPHPPLNPTREMFEPYEGAELPEPKWAENEWEDKPEPLRQLLQMHQDWDIKDFINYRRHFYAMVTGVDMAIGRVLSRLESQDLLADTLIIFCGDHGDMCGDHRMLLKDSSYYDELMRQPCVLFWPRGFGKKGRRIEGLVEMVDVLPTLLELSGCPVPEVMAGRSYAEALLSGGDIEERESVFAYLEPGHTMVRTMTHKYIRYGQGAEVLYNLAETPKEVKNRAKDSSEQLNTMREIMLQRLIETNRSPQKKLYRF